MRDPDSQHNPYDAFLSINSHMTPHYIFISLDSDCGRDFLCMMKDVVKRIRGNKIKVWFDASRRSQANTMLTHVTHAIDTCDFFVPILTNAYITNTSDGKGSETLEFQYAAHRKGAIGMLPVVLKDNCESSVDAENWFGPVAMLLDQARCMQATTSEEIANAILMALNGRKVRNELSRIRASNGSGVFMDSFLRSETIAREQGVPGTTKRLLRYPVKNPYTAANPYLQTRATKPLAVDKEARKIRQPNTRPMTAVPTRRILQRQPVSGRQFEHKNATFQHKNGQLLRPSPTSIRRRVTAIAEELSYDVTIGMGGILDKAMHSMRLKHPSDVSILDKIVLVEGQLGWR